MGLGGITLQESVRTNQTFSRHNAKPLIELDLYGLQPQLNWYNAAACVPVSITNGIKALASYYNNPDLIAPGELYNTVLELGKLVSWDEGGSSHLDYKNSFPNYLSNRGLANSDYQFEINAYSTEKQFSLIDDLLRYFSKGIVLVGGYYVDENGEASSGGHQMTATGIEINDANGNARLDRGEAFLLMIDPLDPASAYIPQKIKYEPNQKQEAKFDQWNKTIQAADDSEANLKKVEIFQPDDKDYFTIIYEQSVILPKDESSDSWQISQQISSTPVEMQCDDIQSIFRSTLTGKIDDRIDISDETRAGSGSIIFEFDDHLKENQVSAEFFCYYDETSSYKNDLGFYQILDEQGTIQDPISGAYLKPGDAGYLQVATKLSDRFEASDGDPSNGDLGDRVSDDVARLANFSFNLTAIDQRALLTPIIKTSMGEIFTSFSAANPDGLNHFRSQGDLDFGFEDQLHLGDRDFNDLHVYLSLMEINGMS